MALPFLVIMIIEALVISKCTTSLTTAAVMSTWKAAQTSTIQFINGMVAIESERMYNMGVTIGALYSNQTMTFGDATLMQVMCALLANYDVNVLYRAAVIVSTESNEIAIGTHGDVKSVSVSQLAGGFSVDHTIDALYLVDPSQAYNFVKPPVIYETTMQPNVTVTIGNRTLGNPLFTAFQEYLDGNIPEVPRRLYWSPMPELLNLILFTYPIIMHETSDDEYERNGQGFVDIRMEAANLCSLMRMHMSSGARLMALMTQSVEQERPIILSNSWEQPVVNDTGVWSINFGYRPVSYLHVDEIHDDLMHSALRHISLPDLAQENFSTMVEFAWSGGPALVSAWQYITPFGMQASMVLVHPLKIISPSTILRLALSTLIAALVGALVCSVAFWTFMEWGISRRLRDIAASMALCADTHGGEMDLPLRTQRTCLGLREVEKLAAVQVEAMARLVNARKYLPAHVACYSPNAQTGPFRSDSESRSSPCSQLRLADDSTVGPAALDMLAKSLRPALLSVVYVRFDQLLESSIAHNRHAHITPLHRMGLQSSSHLKLRRIHASIDQPRHDWIPSPSVVERFLRLTMEYASKHHGVIHQLSPDCCVVIFAEDDAVAHHVEGRRAAMAAVRFALALQGQLLQPRSEIPPVSILVDTNRFDCSSHYSEVLDRKFFVASGRDVNDDVGYVLPLIGVKVGLTEETAVLVQHAVRVLPLEALYVGRPEHSEYTLVLYEALPGPTNQTSWQHFQSCFYQAFLCMTAGKYSEALALFDEAAAVEGLEAELLPASLRSEGQQLRFTCVGDTLSEAWTCMQLDRLTSVCAQHVIMRDGERYVRHPLSEDFLQLLHRHPAAATRSEAASVTSVTSVGGTRPPVEVIDEVAIRQSRLTLLRAERDPLYDRYIAEVPGTKLRYTHSCPDFLIDNHGNRWTLSKEPLKKVNEPMVNRKYLGMSHTGAVAVLYIIPYRVEKSTSPLLADLPLGRLESPLVPMRQKTEEQLRAAELVLTAPCISVEGFVFTVGILGYTNAVEGGIVVVEEYCPGGNIPEMLDRFHRDIPPRAIEGNFPVGLKGLALLHSRGLIHGHIRPEELSVGISGIGRLKGVFADYNMANRLLMLPLSCYVSPEVAAGALPTAKSDVFGLALTVVAAMTAKAPWRWAANQHRATEAQLQELLAGARTVTGHRHFCAELCAGHLQIAPLIPRSGGELKAEMHTVLLQCLNFDPQQRPTAAEALAMLAPSS